MKKQIKRNLSRVLALFVAFVMAATPAFAASFDDLQNAIDGNTDAGVQIGGTDRYGYGQKNEETGNYGVEAWNDADGNRNVQLNENVSKEDGTAQNVTVGSEGGSVNLDLNGNTITGSFGEENSPNNSVIRVDNGGNLTLDDTSNDKSGQITGGYTGVDLVGKDSSFTMNGGTITGNNGDGIGGGVVDRGTFVMNGGTISGNKVTSKGGGVYVTDTGSFEMNDGTISGNTVANGENKPTQGGGVFIKNGGTFEMNGGTISGNTAAQGGGVYTEGGAVINDGTISGNKGTGVTIGNNGSLNMSGGMIGDTAAAGNDGDSTTVSNGNTDSGVVVNQGGTFTMTDGTISGNTATGTVASDKPTTDNENDQNHQMGGGVLVDGGTFNMSGGTISANKTSDTTYRDAVTGNAKGQGGGVAVKNNGTFNLTGGTISENEAGEGGGVFVDDNGHFNMTEGTDASGNATSGTVDSNTAQVGEGGGIYIKGTGKIEAGAITNNVTNTKDDLGGGGIYIENVGKLDLTNVIITDNTANSLGGGIAACVHGKTIMLSVNGAAVYGNHANGNYLVPVTDGDGNVITDDNGNTLYLVYSEKVTANKKVDGQEAWSHLRGDEKDALVNGAQDIFSAGNANLPDGDWTTGETGKSGALIGVIMLGGDMANWQGWKINYETIESDNRQENGHVKLDENGKPVGYKWEEISKAEMSIYADQLLGLTAHPTDSAIDKAMAQGKVIISGNKSNYTHGGGIANNGILRIGAMDTTYDAFYPDLGLNKTLENAENREDAPALKDKEFSFQLTDKDNKVVGTVENDADGKAQFVIPSEYFENANDGDEFVFFVREQDNGVENVTYDHTIYRVTVKISVKTQTATIGNGANDKNHTYTVTTATVAETIIEKVVLDESGKVISAETADGINFNNVYTAPEEPPKEDPKDPPKEDPKDPPKEDPPKDPEEPETPEEPEEPPVDPEEPPVDPEEPPVDPDPEYPPYTPEEPPYSPEYPPYTPDEPVTPPAAPVTPPTAPVTPPTAPVTPPTVDVPTPLVPQAELPEEPEVPVEEVEEPEVPLVEEPEEEEEEEPEEEEFVEIEDPDVPLANVPMTGDNSYIWTIMTLVSGLALVCLALRKKREDKAE